MRRSAWLLLALAILLPACAQGQGQAALPQAQLITAAGLDFTEVQRAVGRFLRAYTQSSDDIVPLERAVGGEDLQEWVYWLEIQNQDTSLEGALEVHRIRVLEVQGDFAAVGVSATVTLTLPDGGTVERRFESPFLLSKQGPGDAWVVVDAVRDGRSMQDAISLIRPPAVVIQDGITVEVPSVFRFSTGTLVNLRVTNESGATIRVSPSQSLLNAGFPLEARATNLALRQPIPVGTAVDGMLEFEQIPLEQAPRAFALGFDEGTAPVIIQLPPEAFAVGQP